VELFTLEGRRGFYLKLLIEKAVKLAKQRKFIQIPMRVLVLGGKKKICNNLLFLLRLSFETSSLAYSEAGDYPEYTKKPPSK